MVNPTGFRISHCKQASFATGLKLESRVLPIQKIRDRLTACSLGAMAGLFYLPFSHLYLTLAIWDDGQHVLCRSVLLNLSNLRSLLILFTQRSK